MYVLALVLLATCHLFPAIIFADANKPSVIRGSRPFVCHQQLWSVSAVCKMGSKGGWVCSDLLVISQCPPTSRWTTSGQPQHLAGQGGLVITAELQTSLRIAWKIQCRTTLPPWLINLPSSSAKHHHQRVISSLLANTMRLPDIQAVLMSKLGMVYGCPLCGNL